VPDGAWINVACLLAQRGKAMRDLEKVVPIAFGESSGSHKHQGKRRHQPVTTTPCNFLRRGAVT
jgi:hypothetical protein